ncbi:putative ABC transporter ATP-binding protein [Blautia producta]|uniref:Putative ABC transporter ATP-binding protein n=1 Tax=Blautia producta TaxID=33035 RepID=A0A4P6M144_9FIRM|nr:ABC transporter ATP-binding protein [Blautia producta]QBE97310.1 putative ABC transporter ATP-binding protein [Blautia producta]
MGKQEKMEKKPGAFRRLLKYIMHHYPAYMIISAVCVLISAVAGSVASVFLQKLIDECIIPGMSQGIDAVWESLLSVITAMAVIYILGVAGAFIYSRLMAIVTQGTLKSLRVDMFKQMESLPIQYFDTHAHGDIMSTYTNDTDALRQMIGQSIPQLVQGILTVVALLAAMLSYSFWLTALVLLTLFLMMLLVKKVGGDSAKYMTKQQISLASEEGFIEEMIQGQKVIKVFCHEEEGKKDFLKYNNQLFHDSEKANIYGNVLMPMLNNIGNLMYVVLAVIGTILVHFKTANVSFSGVNILTVGIIVSFLGMSRQLSQMVGQVSMQVSMVAMGIAGAGRVFDLIDQKAEQDSGYVTLVHAKKGAGGNLEECDDSTGVWAWKHFHKSSNTTTYVELKGDIVMEHVDFGYAPNKQVLYDVSVYARPGQKVAFVGSTGAGKTTITNLINRFYDIEDGKIRYDGININKICKQDLRRSLGIVLQDVNLFTDTVLNNIRYGRLSATDEECIEAAKIANADDFISRLPDGYNTMLTGNGANLSQGQRQLISIARAEVAGTPAMILDEATSSIDTRTERLVQEGMDRLMEGRTVFVIAHRLSTIRNSDAIMVLDHGRIIERGTHDELLNKQGTYYQLYTGALEMA